MLVRVRKSWMNMEWGASNLGFSRVENVWGGGGGVNVFLDGAGGVCWGWYGVCPWFTAVVVLERGVSGVWLQIKISTTKIRRATRRSSIPCGDGKQKKRERIFYRKLVR
jgi:hypothetical protein